MAVIPAPEKMRQNRGLKTSLSLHGGEFEATLGYSRFCLPNKPTPKKLDHGKLGSRWVLVGAGAEKTNRLE